MNDAEMSTVPLWAPGAQCHGDPLKDSVQHSSELSTEGEEVQALSHQLPPHPGG